MTDKPPTVPKHHYKSKMDTGRYLFVLMLFFCLIHDISGAGACFQFTGNGQVSFSPDNLDISSKAHFSLEFNTASETGLIYYAEGTYQRERVYDYEGLFLHNGYLHYFLFNPAEYSIGSSFGFYGRSKNKLNDGQWHKVEFYRNIEMTIVDRYGGRKQVEQTGLIVDGVTQVVDNRRRVGVHIFKPVILGDDPHKEDRGGPQIGGFKGRIKDFKDMIRGYPFDQPGSMKKDVRHCLTSKLDSA